MNDTTTQNTDTSILGFTTAIVSAFVSNSHNQITSDSIAGLISQTYTTLQGLGGAPEVKAEAAPEEKKEPAVSIRASIKPDYLVCLEDGNKVKMLKRYLMTNYSLTPEQYRAKWNLPNDYPMVAPNYSEKRRELAKAIGLGTKGRVAKRAVEALAEVTESEVAEVEAEAQGKTEAAAPKKRRQARKPNKEAANA